ncbi:MAG: hypothetical protein E3J90_01525 [Promethearchaeota archaeon]|nr:MAG: hypothetical protein E3J90_01525 [Candidatus Lokiarchaeota archaeon]
MPTQHKDIKSQRVQIYFDCICGTICSISALIGIFFSTQQEGILNPANFTLGLIFSFGYLGISIFVIGLGIYTYYREKNFNPEAIPKKKLKAPMVG